MRATRCRVGCERTRRMSNSPGAAQAAADNQKFWTGVARLPEPAQKSFWEGGTLLSHYIGENPQPRTLTYDFSSPPANMPWYERILFYIGQSQVNQAVSQMQAGQAMVDGAVWLAGALQGDFNKGPTTGQMITGGIISMIPVVDQVCDVRDIIANCLNLADPKERERAENWVALGLTCIGFVPLAGSAVKTVGKVALHHAGKLIDLLKQMEWLEKHRASLKIMVPWGHAPIDWLKKFDWLTACKQAADKARAAFLNAKGKAESAAKYAFGIVQARLKQLVELFDVIAKRIGQVMQDIAKSIKEKINKLLSRAEKEAGNFDVTPGGPNRHGQGDKAPPKDRPQPRFRQKLIREMSADEANAAHVKAGRNPPYAAGTTVRDVELQETTTFARVHGADNKARSWMMSKSDVEGLTPAQIRDKFALPETPSFVSDVKVPAGTVIRTGEVAPQAGWGAGGATQFELLNRLPESLFTNTRPL
jgi:hypothetical protein